MPPWQALEGEAATPQPLRSGILDLLATEARVLRRDHGGGNHGSNDDELRQWQREVDQQPVHERRFLLQVHSDARLAGSGIVVFGTVPSSDSTSKPPTASFTLDASPPFITTQASADRPVANQPLFASPKLSGDEHQIVINITSVGARSPFTLDYFLIFPNPNGSSTEATVSFSEPPSATTPWPSAIAVTNSATATAKPQAGTESLQNAVKILSVLMGVLVFS
ncbi:hypothetical protein BDZ89DRAFT_1037423 [Hymenopellis radicata]|nr:hypothetical protein BDZ89DRAFT_1037423 [Hymenopellis radicata]